MSKKRFVYEKSVDLDLFKTIGIHRLFSEVNLESLLKPPRVVYPELVKEFYASFELESDSLIKSRVKNEPVSIY